MIHLQGKKIDVLIPCIFMIVIFLPHHYYRIILELYMQGVFFLEEADFPGINWIVTLADTRLFFGLGFEAINYIFYTFLFMVFSGFSIRIFQKKFGLNAKEAIAIPVLGFFSLLLWALLALLSLVLLNGDVFFTAFYFSVIVGPVLEELFFRGLLYKFLLDLNVKIVPTTIIISVIFVFAHSNIDGLFAYLNFFLVSSSLVYFRWKYKSIIIPILIHMALNFIGYFELSVLKKLILGI